MLRAISMKSDSFAFGVSIGLHIFVIVLLIKWHGNAPQRIEILPLQDELQVFALYSEHMDSPNEAMAGKSSVSTHVLSQTEHSDDVLPDVAGYSSPHFLYSDPSESFDAVSNNEKVTIMNEAEPSALSVLNAANLEVVDDVLFKSKRLRSGVPRITKETSSPAVSPEVGTGALTDSIKPRAKPFPGVSKERKASESPRDIPLQLGEAKNTSRDYPFPRLSEEKPDALTASAKGLIPALDSNAEQRDALAKNVGSIVGIDVEILKIEAEVGEDVTSNNSLLNPQPPREVAAAESSPEPHNSLRHSVLNPANSTEKLALILPGVFSKPEFANSNNSLALLSEPATSSPRALSAVPSPSQEPVSKGSCQEVVRVSSALLKKLQQWHTRNTTNGVTIEMLLNSNRFASISGSGASISELLMQQQPVNAAIIHQAPPTIGHLLLPYMNRSASYCQK